MIQLNQGQQNVLQSASKFLTSSSERQMVIKGRAGTGKSTLVQEIVPLIYKYQKLLELLLKQESSLPIYLTATTNKAAKVLADLTGEETCTLHSLLGLIVKNDYSNGNTTLSRKADSKVICNSIILIDEAFYICPRLLEFIE
jgi:ATP-dependent exoDNAse (exonuclease V) alpha subunit